jgi:RimJ/RimL family protein N-acetyltransferase
VGLPYTFTGRLRTDRVAIRPLTPADVDAVHAYESDPEVCRYLPYAPRSREEVAGNIARWGAALAFAGEGDYWRLAVERTAEPGVIGDVYLALKSVRHGSAEIGWVLHPAHHGRGYMTEAAGALLGLAFTELELHRVSVALDPRNAASAALCARLGMRREARFVEDHRERDEWVDTTVYAILAREWRARREAGARSGR